MVLESVHPSWKYVNSKLGFYIMFHIHGHIGTGPQHMLHILSSKKFLNYNYSIALQEKKEIVFASQ